MTFGVWCPEKRTWLETLFGQIQEFSFTEAGVQARELKRIAARDGLAETYVVREIGPHGEPVE